MERGILVSLTNFSNEEKRKYNKKNKRRIGLV